MFGNKELASFSCGDSSTAFYDRDIIRLDEAKEIANRALSGLDEKKDFLASSSRDSSGRVSRGRVFTVEFEDQKLALVRPMLRGGLLGKVNREHFLSPSLIFGLDKSDSKSRVYRELAINSYLFAKGFNVPKPLIGIVTRSKLPGFSTQVFVSEFLDSFTNLLSYILDSDNLDSASLEEMKVLLEKLGQEVRVLVEERIFHPDLHPGNVMVNLLTKEVRVIDFDKAGFYPRMQSSELIEKYISRWNRSLDKHSLEEWVRRGFERGIIQEALI